MKSCRVYGRQTAVVLGSLQFPGVQTELETQLREGTSEELAPGHSVKWQSLPDSRTCALTLPDFT